MARRRHDPISLKIPTTMVFVGSAAAVLFYIPPSSIFIVVGYIVLLGICAYMIASLLTKNKLSQILAVFGISAFLVSNLIAGFNLLNTLLLLSFIIGVRLLFR